MVEIPGVKHANANSHTQNRDAVLRTRKLSRNGETPVARAPEIVLLMCVAVAFVLALAQSMHEIRIPYQIDSGEGVVLEGAVQLTHAQPLYPPANQFPYTMRVYGPLAYALVAVPVKIAGVNFLWPRFLVLLCALFTSFCIAALLRSWTGSWLTGLVFGGAYVALPITRTWLYMLRVDFIGLAFALLGLLIFTRSPRHWTWSALLFGAAIFCKLSLVAAPAAVFLCMLLENKRRALVFLFSLAALSGGVFALIQVRTH